VERKYPPTQPGGAEAEVFLFIRGGRLSSLEYVCYDDQIPAVFPDPATLEIILQR
jgi:hypothetical protein